MGWVRVISSKFFFIRVYLQPFFFRPPKKETLKLVLRVALIYTTRCALQTMVEYRVMASANTWPATLPMWKVTDMGGHILKFDQLLYEAEVSQSWTPVDKQEQ